MNRCILLACLATAPLAVGCIQPLDGGLTSSGRSAGPSGGPSGPPLTEAGLPLPFGNVDPSQQQCEPNSPLCYELCGSPSCALIDNSIPSEIANAPVQLPDGGLSSVPCNQIEAESLAIRTRSCSQCHAPGGPAASILDCILDDTKLQATMSNAASGIPLVTAGNTSTSYVYVRMSALGTLSEMPPPKLTGLSTDVAKTVVRPTAQDLSIMYAWIAYCIGPNGGTGGPASSDYGYGRGYAPDAGLANVAAPPMGSGMKDGGGAVKDAAVAGQADSSVSGDASGPSGSPDGGSGSPGGNLITNGNFANGTTMWGVVSGTGTLSIMNGGLCVAVQANTPVVLGWPEPAATAGAALAAGTSYTFAYSARATVMPITVSAKVSDTRAPSYLPLDFESLTDPVPTNGRGNLTHTFTPASGADPSAGLSFSFTSPVAQSICFQNVSVQ